MRDTDVVVVGAGLAGLVAARRLTQAGLDVVVLEARERVGGRTWTKPVDGGYVEAGGQFVGPGQDRILALAAELGVGTFPVHNAGRHVLRLRGRHRTYRHVPGLSPWVLADVAQATARLQRAARRVSPVQPWSTPALDEQSFEGWLQDTVRTEQGRDMLRLACRGLLAAAPAQTSALHVAFLLASAGGMRALTEVRGGAQEWRLAGGAQALSERMAAELDVRLGQPVARITWSPNGVEVGGLRARRVVVAVPPALGARIDFDPPTGREALLAALPHGDVVKVSVTYDAPWWRDLGLSGQAASDGPVRATFDNTLPDTGPGILMAFLGRGEDDPIEALEPLFGPRVRRARQVVVTDWSDEPWTGGCYGALFPPGVWTAHGPALRPPVGPLHWAGSETAERWMLYMDGAVESGERAAREIVGR